MCSIVIAVGVVDVVVIVVIVVLVDTRYPLGTIQASVTISQHQSNISQHQSTSQSTCSQHPSQHLRLLLES